jgi:MYXO-CTERM domain-containing protein
MISKKLIVFLPAVTCGCLPLFAGFQLLDQFDANIFPGASAGEIVSYSGSNQTLYVTSSGTRAGESAFYGINYFNMSDPSNVSAAGRIDFTNLFGGVNGANTLGLSSVAVNATRGFGVASLIPTASTSGVGKVGFFDLATNSVIGSLDVGYHPDSVTFSSDGNYLIVVNEGEFRAGQPNVPGSITLFDISGVNAGNVGSTLPALTGTTKDFSAANLASGVTLDGIRNSNITLPNSAVPNFNDPDPTKYLAIEPEYASEIGGKIYVSLQDNNALAEFDIATGQWTKVESLGTITQRIDATDTGGTQVVDDVVKGMPMPDTIGAFTKNGKTYIVSANEGDFRVDDGDLVRFGAGGATALLDTNYPTDDNAGVRADSQLGRLNISRIDGDTDLDGKIDDIVMAGTRSISIWEKTDDGFVLADDSGSQIEDYLAALGVLEDGRSDDKGPEPEGLVLGEIDGFMYAFVGMERSNDIFQFDITDPYNIFMVDRIELSGPARPEGMYFVPGENLLIVGYEGTADSGYDVTQQIGVFQVSVPEPGTVGLALVALGAVGMLRRRRG